MNRTHCDKCDAIMTDSAGWAHIHVTIMPAGNSDIHIPTISHADLCKECIAKVLLVSGLAGRVETGPSPVVGDESWAAPPRAPFRAYGPMPPFGPRSIRPIR